MSAQRDGLLKRCACAVERWPKCPHPWWLLFKFDGVRWAVSLTKHCALHGDPRALTTRGDAEALADEIRTAIRLGTYVRRPARVARATATTTTGDGLTFGQLVARFTVEKLKALGIVSWGNDAGMLRKLAATPVVDADGVTAPLGDRALDTLTEAMCEAVYRTTAHYANGTRSKYKRALKRVWKWAVSKQLAAASPLTDDAVLPTAPGTVRMQRIKPDLEGDLVAAATEGKAGGTKLAALIVAAIETGGRRGELLALQWRDVHRDAGYLDVRAVEVGARKSKRPRRVPLTPRLRAVLDALPACDPAGHAWAPSAYVFGDAIGARVKSVRKAWDTAVLRAHRIEPGWTKRGGSLDAASRAHLAQIDVHFHDLRHEAALRWHEAGVELNAIATLLGHHDLSLLRVYLGIGSDDALAAHAARLAPATPPPAPATATGLGVTPDQLAAAVAAALATLHPAPASTATGLSGHKRDTKSGRERSTPCDTTRPPGAGFLGHPPATRSAPLGRVGAPDGSYCDERAVR